VDLPHNRAYIVELNPFGAPDGMGTGTVMFDIDDAHDCEILFGREAFEFRVETQYLGPIKLKDPWKSFLQQQGYIDKSGRFTKRGI
jgi:hypothetical protein